MLCIVWCTRLLQHAAALRQLTHRNIAAVYDAFSAENCTADGADSAEQTLSFSVYVVQVIMQTYLRPIYSFVTVAARVDLFTIHLYM